MISIIGYVAAILTTISAVPQLIHIVRTRDVRGVSIRSWLVLSAGVALWLVYGLFAGSGPLIFANAISLGLDLTIVALSLRLRLNPA